MVILTEPPRERLRHGKDGIRETENVSFHVKLQHGDSTTSVFVNKRIIRENSALAMFPFRFSKSPHSCQFHCVH